MLLYPPLAELVGVAPAPFEAIDPELGEPTFALTPSTVK